MKVLHTFLSVYVLLFSDIISLSVTQSVVDIKMFMCRRRPRCCSIPLSKLSAYVILCFSIWFLINAINMAYSDTNMIQYFRSPQSAYIWSILAGFAQQLDLHPQSTGKHEKKVPHQSVGIMFGKCPHSCCFWLWDHQRNWDQTWVSGKNGHDCCKGTWSGKTSW